MYDLLAKPDVVWGALIMLGAAYELAALRTKRQGDTLSETTRKWFMTDKPAGKVAFGVAWVGFSGWYLWHILW
jgi:hypothetical protein